jgi:hypothetical protein
MRLAGEGEPAFMWRPTSWFEHNFTLALAAAPTVELAVLRIGGASPTVARLEAHGCRLVFVAAALPYPSILVYDTTDRAKLAVFEWRSQKLRLPDGGRQLRWKRSTLPFWRPETVRDANGFLRPGYVIADHQGPLLYFSTDGRIRCAYAIPATSDNPRIPPSLLALLALGWLLITLSSEEVA